MNEVKTNRVVTPAVLADGTFVEVHALKRPTPNGVKYGSRTLTEWRKATRVYVDEASETILMNLLNRFNRPMKAYKAIALEALTHVELDGYRLAWSQRAGCSCGCSPGFILRSPDNVGVVTHRVDDSTPVDIYVKVFGNVNDAIVRALAVGLSIV